MNVPRLVTNLVRFKVPAPVNSILPPLALLSSKLIVAVEALILPPDETTTASLTSKLLDVRSKIVFDAVTVRSLETLIAPAAVLTAPPEIYRL